MGWSRPDASRLNKQCDLYVSWKPDPDAFFIDAFTESWKNIKFYAFPPFGLVNKVLCKIIKEEAEGLIIVPLWVSQPWFPSLLRILIDNPIVLPLNVLSLPYKKALQPLHKKLRLIACHVSGNHLNGKVYRKKLPNSCSHRSVNVLKLNIGLILRDGFLTALKGK